MYGVIRFIALAALAGGVAGCVTDGMVGAEPDVQAAKPRVIDTPKTRSVAAKKNAPRAATATEAQGDTGPRTVAARAEPDTKQDDRQAARPRTASEGTMIPAQSLFGNWTLGAEDGSQKCRVVLGGVPIGTAYAARGEADCPQAISAVQTWEIDGDELVLRNQSRGVVGRLQPTGPFRFDGQSDGASVYLVR
jgi:hypothetical protein